MTPDDIKARFLHEYIKSSNLEAIRNEIAAGLRSPVGPPPDFRVHMIAALETVAADIWDEGWEQGMAYVVGMERGTDDDHAITNPYRASERRA